MTWYALDSQIIAAATLITLIIIALIAQFRVCCCYPHCMYFTGYDTAATLIPPKGAPNNLKSHNLDCQIGL